MTYSNPAVTLSVRIPPKVRDQLEELADVTGRTKSFLAAEAIENYLATQAWQVKAIKKAIQKADHKGAKFIEHHQVIDWVKGWDTKDETEMP
jgi:RHH-type transcriptional regulator, rel operon repressor / antitoxin RelB